MFSKSPINQATSKAMLTQMISIIFRRMEVDLVWSSKFNFTVFLGLVFALGD